MKLNRIIIPLLFVLLSILVLDCCTPKEKEPQVLPLKETLEMRAEKIHNEVLTVDTHVDTPYQLLRPDYDISLSHDPRKGGGRVDFPRMKAGGLDAIFFAVFVGQGPCTSEGYQKVKKRALSLFDAIHKTLNKHTDLAELARTPADAYRIEKTGKRAIFIGIENGYAVGKDISLIQKYYQLGARYITLCHTRNNDICDSSTDRKGPEHHGLSEFGKKVVQEMNRVGMIIDVSHISDEAFYDVLEVSKAPVIASHSSVRALCDSSRNLNDSMLKKLADKGGVIQICILSSYIKKPDPNPQRDAAFNALRKKYKNFSTLSADERKQARRDWMELNKKFPQKLATVSDVVDHIDHVVQLVGIDHVGIGTDFDGGGGVNGCFDVSEMRNITLELVKRGYSKEQIRKIWGSNTMRVFREVERISEKRQ